MSDETRNLKTALQAANQATQEAIGAADKPVSAQLDTDLAAIDTAIDAARATLAGL